jgi:hypothetical protein
MSDGTLRIVFSLMPPSFAEDDERSFSDFDEQLEHALGVAVTWDDREVFVIAQPWADTAAKLKAFLEAYGGRRGR